MMVNSKNFGKKIEIKNKMMCYYILKINMGSKALCVVLTL